MAGKILITPNTGSLLTDPTIVYQGSESTTEITQRIKSTSAIAFESAAGTVLEITNGSNGSVLIGTTTDNGTDKLQVNGTVSATNISGTNTGDQTITLTGDVTGTGTGSFTTTLSTTGVTAGTYDHPTITVDDKGRITSASSNSVTTGTVTSVSVTTANGVSGTVANAATTPAITLTLGAITPTSVVTTGDVTVGGNLTVSGTTTTIDATTLSVADLNITIGSGATTASAANGAGLTVGNYASNPTMLYGNANDNFTFNRRVDATSFHGPLVGDVTGNVSGTAAAITGTYSGTLTSSQITAALGFTPGAGGGSVSSVSVTTANGVSGTVANAATTPAITLSLGAITPTSVAATGTVSGSNLSGTNTGDETTATIKSKLGITTLSGSNTGDQTIQLTGDVTGSGTGSFVATLATTNASPQTDAFRKVTVNGKGLVTNTSAVAATDITTALGFTPYNSTNPNGYITSSGTAAVANGLTAANNYRVNSLGVGTPASGTAGEIRATGDIIAYYSDDRLKTRLGNIENAVEKIRTLDAFYYEANETAQALGYVAKREVGLSAQQVQKIMPEITPPAPIDDKYLTINYERMVPLLVAAVKELSDQNVALLAEIEKLKAK